MPLPANLHFVMTTASCLAEHQRGPNGSQRSQWSHVIAWWHPMARYCRVGLGRRGDGGDGAVEKWLHWSLAVTGVQVLGSKPSWLSSSQARREGLRNHMGQKICWHPKWIKMDGLTWFNARNCHTWGPYSLLTPQFFFHIHRLAMCCTNRMLMWGG